MKKPGRWQGVLIDLHLYGGAALVSIGVGVFHWGAGVAVFGALLISYARAA